MVKYLLNIVDNINIIPRSNVLLEQLFDENPGFAEIIKEANDPEEANRRVYNMVMRWMEGHDTALAYFRREEKGHDVLSSLTWREVAAIRLLDYVENHGRVVDNFNKKIKKSITDPIRIIWMGYHKGKGGGKPEFFIDMIHLMRQFSGSERKKNHSRKRIESWIDRHLSGNDEEVIKMREENRDRILKIIIRDLESGELKSDRFSFAEGLSEEEKLEIAKEWWNDYRFHLKFAIRNPEKMNEMLSSSLDPDRMYYLNEAVKKGIPFFINPYYLSLLNVNTPVTARHSDLAIRDYVFYSKEFIREFGSIVAWEKEDRIEQGKPNAAGWLLPDGENIHRRYPEVSIMIPDTIGRACGGLCVSCQRMYNFQRGRLNFNLEKLKPDKSWDEKLERLMDYFRFDSQLRDILITGGDAFMSSNKTIEKILDAVYRMAVSKREDNKNRAEGKKYAEMVRVRLGSRLPVYIPQRIDHDLIRLLKEFKKKATTVGIKQFVIQTHFVSPMEITPEAKKAIKMLNDAGWVVFNQMVYTAAASRRGYASSLRKHLNNIGVLTYYTFTVKGFMENHHNFTPNCRAVQEQFEEKAIGQVPREELSAIKSLPDNTGGLLSSINAMRKKYNIPFLATDRNVMNLPAVGKSLTFRTIGITRRGRRILEFDHDISRNHSPIINKQGRVTIIESKPVMKYLKQLKDMGENTDDYIDIWGYSMNETETISTLFEYPEYNYDVTPDLTNLDI